MRERLGRQDHRGRLSHLEAWDLVGRANWGENENGCGYGHEVVNWMRWYLGLTAEGGGFESDERGQRTQIDRRVLRVM